MSAPTEGVRRVGDDPPATTAEPRVPKAMRDRADEIIAIADGVRAVHLDDECCR